MRAAVAWIILAVEIVRDCSAFRYLCAWNGNTAPNFSQRDMGKEGFFRPASSLFALRDSVCDGEANERIGSRRQKIENAAKRPLAFVTRSMALTVALAGLALGSVLPPSEAAVATSKSTETVTIQDLKYDGFADYAKDNQMEQSDVGCFVKQCGDQTKALFSNPRGIKGVSCLGRCKGEQSCATRCFAQFGSNDLDNWLSCTIEDNECVKVPKNIDNSAQDIGYSTAVKKFDSSSLVGTWYKTDGLNPNYDLFDCQTNTFTPIAADNKEFDMGINFRVLRPEGGYWENSLIEHMVVDSPNSQSPASPPQPSMHTNGKMYGLTFSENWYIIGESDGHSDVPPFKLVAYKGHTLQGNYEGSFVYAKESELPIKALPAVKKAAEMAGLDFDKFTKIDNSCPTTTKPLNVIVSGGPTTKEWLDLVVGEGGVVDWVFPGWRGEYKS